jgi:hypothetical protein
MTKFCVLIVFFISTEVAAQTEFFHSKINFSESQLDSFYSSFGIDSTQVYFNANDYYVYAYDKKTEILNWSHYVANKSNNAPKLYQNNVFIRKHLSEYENKCVQLNAKTGDTIQTLTIESINTQPFFKGDIMFCTAINPEIGGAVLAYDLKKNSVIWQKFIAHGVDKQPYYLKHKIIANVEADNWFEINYNGKLLDITCNNKSNIFAEDIKCVKNYKFLTHDGKKITVEFIGKNTGNYGEVKVKSSKNITIVLSYENLLIIGNNKKIKKNIEINQLIALPEIHVNDYMEILQIKDNKIWFFYENTLVVYDFKNDKILKTYDLTQWNAHQAVLEGNNLWLISRKDGELIGLELEPDLKAAAMIKAKAEMQREIDNCNKPDPKMVEAAKKAQKKLMKNN